MLTSNFSPSVSSLCVPPRLFPPAHLSVFKTETHKPDHRLEPVYQAETFLDRDYCLPHNTGYSYLDPNYFPANR